MNPPPSPIASAPSGSPPVTLLGWAFIITGIIGLPISLISGAMVFTKAHGTQHAEVSSLLTVVPGPSAVLVCGIGLLRHWTWAWWGSVLLAGLVCAFSLHAWLKPVAPPFTYTTETGTMTTVYASRTGLLPAIISGGLLVLLLLPGVREQFPGGA